MDGLWSNLPLRMESMRSFIIAALKNVIWSRDHVIQVCLELHDPSTKERETSGLFEAMDTFFLDEGLIITEHDEEEEIVERSGKQYHITLRPIRKWRRMSITHQ